MLTTTSPDENAAWKDHQMYRTFFLALSRSEFIKRILLAWPFTRSIVKHFVAGSTWNDAREAVDSLREKGFKTTVGYLGFEIRTSEQADAVVQEYLEFLDQVGLDEAGDDVELSVKLSSLGLLLRGGEKLAEANAAKIAEKAREIGTTITIDMEDLTTTAKAIRIVKKLRTTYPDVGVLLQANLRRTEADCRAFEAPSSRIRLSKGAYKPPTEASYADKHDVDLHFVRCMKTLMEGEGVPLIATHDPVLIDIAQELAAHNNRSMKDFEFQMLYGVRTMEQARLIDLGHTVRIYVPFGENWYSYFIRRLAERPANFFFFVRGLLTK